MHEPEFVAKVVSPKWHCRRYVSIGGGCLVLLGLFFVLSGCVTSRKAADRIVSAPNLHKSYNWDGRMNSMWGSFQTNIPPGTTSNLFLHLTLPVGPPAAGLRVVVLPPHDYQRKVKSEVKTNANGKHSVGLRIFRDTNSAVAFEAMEHPATIFMLHGYMLGKETMGPWALLLQQAGYRVVLVDLRGHGQSTGDTVTYGKYETVDLSQVLDQLVVQGQCEGPVGVLGNSYGATLALHWAARDPRVRTVVAIAPYNHPAEAFERFAREFKVPITHRSTQKAVALAAQRLGINWEDWSGEAAIRQVKVPVLLIGAEKDSISRPDDITTLQKAAGGETKVIEVPIANHVVISLFFNELAGPVKEWFRERLPPPAPP